GIFCPAILKSGGGVIDSMPRSNGSSAEAAMETSWKFFQDFICEFSNREAICNSHRQLSCISEAHSCTWKNRWARPSLLTSVPSDSAKVPAEMRILALLAVG